MPKDKKITQAGVGITAGLVAYTAALAASVYGALLSSPLWWMLAGALVSCPIAVAGLSCIAYSAAIARDRGNGDG